MSIESLSHERFHPALRQIRLAVEWQLPVANLETDWKALRGQRLLFTSVLEIGTIIQMQR